MAGITFGPKLGLLNNANIGETYYDQFRVFLQAIDQLVQMSVLAYTLAVPPSNPNNGDAYLLLQPTPTGAWTGFLGYIAVWNTQVTTDGTNNQVPQWVFYKPQPGWIVWIVATQGLAVYTGTSWAPVGGGISGVVPVVSGGTGATDPADARTNLGAAASGANDDITSLEAVFAPNGGSGIAVNGAGTGAAIFVTNGIQTSGWGVNGIIDVEGMNCAGSIISGTLQTSAANPALTTNGIIAQVTNGPLQLQGQGSSQAGVQINSSGVTQQQLLALSNYFTQTTVGSAGAASALPATPSLYIQISINGTVYIFPVYARA